MAAPMGEGFENVVDPLLMTKSVKENIKLSNFESSNERAQEQGQNSDTESSCTFTAINVENCFRRERNIAGKILKGTWIAILVVLNLVGVTMLLMQKFSVDKNASTLNQPTTTNVTLETSQDSLPFTQSTFRPAKTTRIPSNVDEPLHNLNSDVDLFRNKNPNAFPLVINSKITTIPANIDVNLTICGDGQPRDWVTWVPENADRVVAVVLVGHFDSNEVDHFRQTFSAAQFFS